LCKGILGEEKTEEQTKNQYKISHEFTSFINKVNEPHGGVLDG
jgi:hypothetical protein